MYPISLHGLGNLGSCLGTDHIPSLRWQAYVSLGGFCRMLDGVLSVSSQVLFDLFFSFFLRYTIFRLALTSTWFRCTGLEPSRPVQQMVTHFALDHYPLTNHCMKTTFFLSSYSHALPLGIITSECDVSFRTNPRRMTPYPRSISTSTGTPRRSHTTRAR